MIFLISEGWREEHGAALTAAAFFSGSYENLKRHGAACCGSLPRRGLIENLSCGQFSCPCMTEHPDETMQNLSGRMTNPRVIFQFGMNIFTVRRLNQESIGKFSIYPESHADIKSLYDLFLFIQNELFPEIGHMTNVTLKMSLIGHEFA